MTVDCYQVSDVYIDLLKFARRPWRRWPQARLSRLAAEANAVAAYFALHIPAAIGRYTRGEAVDLVATTAVVVLCLCQYCGFELDIFDDAIHDELLVAFDVDEDDGFLLLHARILSYCRDRLAEEDAEATEEDAGAMEEDMGSEDEDTWAEEEESAADESAVVEEGTMEEGAMEEGAMVVKAPRARRRKRVRRLRLDGRTRRWSDDHRTTGHTSGRDAFRRTARHYNLDRFRSSARFSGGTRKRTTWRRSRSRPRPRRRRTRRC